MAGTAPDPSTNPESSAEELYQHAPCGYLSTWPDGTIIRANQTFLDWIQRPADGLFGQQRFQSLLTVGARMYYETHYAPLLQMQGFVNEIALEMRRADGTVCPVVASARQVRSATGETKLVRIALFDSTDRRRYERELLLERRRAEEAATALAEVDRRRNEFIALLAHELRNPLAPIRSAVEILRRSERVSDAVGQTAMMLQRQVAQLARLVDDLLDMSRVGQNKLSLHRVPIDLASVLHHAVETSEPLLREAGLTFTLTLPDRPIYMEADAARLTQVIGNLLNNAAKFTPRGGDVSLRLQLTEQGAEIRVADTGIGIEEVKLSQVFDLFMQADRSLGRKDGLGIGLALARSLVDRHGGRLTVHSRGLGTGTEFVVALPILSEAPASISRSKPAPSPAPAAVSRRVLVVDDNRDSSQMMALLLELFGHDVRQAHDGSDAVTLSAAFQPHVVLLDIGLPLMNGYEAAARIRTQVGTRPMLVAMTGWGEDDDRRRSEAAGFDHHLIKPIDHDVLVNLIASLPPPSAI